MKRILALFVLTLLFTQAVAKQFDAETLKLAAAQKVLLMLNNDCSVDEVLPVIDKAITEGRQSSDLYMYQGWCYLNKVQLPLMSQSFSKAIQQSGYKPDMYEKIAGAYCYNDQYTDASATIKDLVSRLKKSTVVDKVLVKKYENIASAYTFMAYYQNGQNESAMQELRKLGEQNDSSAIDLLSEYFYDRYKPQNPSMEDEDVLYQDSSDYTFLSYCTQETPLNSLVWLLMSDMDAYYGNYESARTNLQEVIKLTPSLINCFDRLFIYSLDLYDFDTAYPEYKRLTSAKMSDIERLKSVMKVLDYTNPMDELVPVIDTLSSEVDEYKYTTSDIPEYVQNVLDFFTWTLEQHPEDAYAKWLQARIMAEYNIFECRDLIIMSSELTEYDKALLAYTYYLEDDYQKAYSIIEKLSTLGVLDCVFSVNELNAVYNYCSKYEKLAYLAIEHARKEGSRENMYFNVRLITDFSGLRSTLNTVKKYGASTDQQKVKTAKLTMDYIAYEYLKYDYSNKVSKEQKLELISYISNKNTLAYANLLIDIGKEAQAKEILSLLNISKKDDLFYELKRWGGLYHSLKQYSEALTYYQLAHYIDELDGFDLTNLFECYYLAGMKQSVKELLPKMITHYSFFLSGIFIDNPSIFAEYFDWLYSDLDYNWATAFALYKLGEYAKTEKYIREKGNMYDDDMFIYEQSRLIASQPGWKPILSENSLPLESTSDILLYHPETIKCDQSSITIWVMILSKSAPENSYETTLSKQLWKIDTNKRQYRIIQGASYLKDGSTRSIPASEDWEYPIPDSVGYSAVNFAIKHHKKLMSSNVKKS